MLVCLYCLIVKPDQLEIQPEDQLVKLPYDWPVNTVVTVDLGYC